MPRNVRSFEESSCTLSLTCAVGGGVAAAVVDMAELAAEGTGEARVTEEPRDDDAMY